VTEARHIEELSVKELAEVERAEVSIDNFIAKRAREARDSGRTEELFEESALAYEEKRRQQRAREWALYHERQARALEATFVVLLDRHRAAQARYQAMLYTTNEGEEKGV
jgi:hypothetical protein